MRGPPNEKEQEHLEEMRAEIFKILRSAPDRFPDSGRALAALMTVLETVVAECLSRFDVPLETFTAGLQHQIIERAKMKVN